MRANLTLTAGHADHRLQPAGARHLHAGRGRQRADVLDRRRPRRCSANTTDVQIATLTNIYEYRLARGDQERGLHGGGPGRQPDPVRAVHGRGDLHLPRRPGLRATGTARSSPMTAELSDGETVTFTHLPAGAACTITETDDKGARHHDHHHARRAATPASTDGTATGDRSSWRRTRRHRNTAVVTNTFAVGSMQRDQKGHRRRRRRPTGPGRSPSHMTCVLDDASGTRTVWDDTIVLGGEAPLARDDRPTSPPARRAPSPSPTTAAPHRPSSTPPVRSQSTQTPTATVTVTNSFDPGALLHRQEGHRQQRGRSPRTRSRSR